MVAYYKNKNKIRELTSFALFDTGTFPYFRDAAGFINHCTYRIFSQKTPQEQRRHRRRQLKYRSILRDSPVETLAPHTKATGLKGEARRSVISTLSTQSPKVRGVCCYFLAVLQFVSPTPVNPVTPAKEASKNSLSRRNGEKLCASLNRHGCTPACCARMNAHVRARVSCVAL